MAGYYELFVPLAADSVHSANFSLKYPTGPTDSRSPCAHAGPR